MNSLPAKGSTEWYKTMSNRINTALYYCKTARIGMNVQRSMRMRKLNDKNYKRPGARV